MITLLNIFGLENATFWSNPFYYSLTQFHWLLHVLNIISLFEERIFNKKTSYIIVTHLLNILGPENATFWGDYCYFSITWLLWLLHILNILGPENANFEATPFSIVYPSCNVVMVTIGTEHTESGKCHFLREHLLLQFNQVVMVITYAEHTRSR